MIRICCMEKYVFVVFSFFFIENESILLIIVFPSTLSSSSLCLLSSRYTPSGSLITKEQVSTKHDKIKHNKIKQIFFKLNEASNRRKQIQEQAKESETHSFSQSRVPQTYSVNTIIYTQRTSCSPI